MSETPINTYEGMFLFPQSATADLNAASEHVQKLLARADAKILSFAKWDERRLAYEIKGAKRGVYFLTYFKAPANLIKELERVANLSEELLRFMILRADTITQEEIEAAEGREKLSDEINLRKTDAENAGSSDADSGSDANAENGRETVEAGAEVETSA